MSLLRSVNLLSYHKHLIHRFIYYDITNNEATSDKFKLFLVSLHDVNIDS